ncbi:hypothetical protein AXX17_AT3G31100 [Arabidopsis thaliana]|uniref:ATPase AAA-type core domain-containing protein n=1 Tax=Arabidopsis thaliana TaxID=3702 RepID=A0A178VLB2_ARATH|nr:hypothetical protein AXX17_AT3G31100 [Arabidopsis thaliana]
MLEVGQYGVSPVRLWRVYVLMANGFENVCYIRFPEYTGEGLSRQPLPTMRYATIYPRYQLLGQEIKGQRIGKQQISWFLCLDDNEAVVVCFQGVKLQAMEARYLLFGPPGTGKSTMISAIANFLEYDVYDLELTTVKDNAELKKLMLDTKGKSIVVIEDIDCSLELTEHRKKKKEEDEDKEEKEGS